MTKEKKYNKARNVTQEINETTTIEIYDNDEI